MTALAAILLDGADAEARGEQADHLIALPAGRGDHRLYLTRVGGISGSPSLQLVADELPLHLVEGLKQVGPVEMQRGGRVKDHVLEDGQFLPARTLGGEEPDDRGEGLVDHSLDLLGALVGEALRDDHRAGVRDPERLDAEASVLIEDLRGIAEPPARRAVPARKGHA